MADISNIFVTIWEWLIKLGGYLKQGIEFIPQKYRIITLVAISFMFAYYRNNKVWAHFNFLYILKITSIIFGILMLGWYIGIHF